MKRVVSILAVSAACVAPGVASAAVVSSGTPSNTVSLSSYTPHSVPMARSPLQLRKGTWYVATVSGLLSYYAPGNYTKPHRPYHVLCGTPVLAGGLTYGLDAEFTLARPWNTRKCTNAKLPGHWRKFQVFGPWGWAHPRSLGPTPTAPTADHTYSYVIEGTGARALFRLKDGFYRDNYGSLNISLRPATTTDCVDYYSFGFSSAASCATGLAAESPLLRHSARLARSHRRHH